MLFSKSEKSVVMNWRDQIQNFGAFILVFGVQCILVSYTFPLSGLWSDDPLFFSDGVRHWYRMQVGVTLAEAGKVLGYDPFLAAGSIGGIQDNPAAKIPTFLAIVLNPWFSAMTIWKVYSFGAAFVGPLSIPLAFRWLRLDGRVILLGSLLGLILWWASMFRWFHTQGLVSFVLVAYLAVPYFVRIIVYLNGRGGWKTLISLGAFGGVAIFCHPLFALPIMIGTIIYLVINWSTSTLSRKLWLLLIVPALSLLPNLWWFYLTFFYPISNSVDIQVPYQRFVDINLVWKELLGIWTESSHGSEVYLLILIPALWALIKTHSGQLLGIVRCFWALWVALTLFAHVGASINAVANIEPNRWAPVAYLFLVIPAAIGFFQAIDAMRKSTLGVRGLSLPAMASIVVIGILSIFILNEVRREISYADIGHYGVRPPEVKALGEYSKWVLNWLKRDTTSEGRVLFEVSKARIHDGSRMSGYYAYSSGREFIGGPYPFKHFANFWDQWLFNRPIEEIENMEFQQYAELYNVGWILVFSDASKRYFDQMPGVRAIDGFKKLKAYALEAPLTYFLEGQGKVQHRDFNQLLLTDLQGETIILKYHYLRGIKSDPSVQIEPVFLMDDPDPFIKIVNPPITLMLFL